MNHRHPLFVLCSVLLCLLTVGRAQAGLVELVAASKPAVVVVGTFNATASPRFTLRGTGFVVGDGSLVVTNAHVIGEPTEASFGTQLRVRVVAGSAAPAERVATVLRINRGHDLALLRIEGDPLPTLKLGGADMAPEGTAVALIGFPIGGVLGFSPVTHRGIVSSVTNIVLPPPTARVLTERTVAQIRDGAFAIYQLDATAYPGNSGGPLIDIDSGLVIGVVNSVFVKSTRESVLSNPSGITYAIPLRHVLDLLKP
jgi:S1-C subfamily serine protease